MRVLKATGDNPAQERWFSLIRHIVTGVGAFFIGRQFLGNTIDESFLEKFLGFIFTVIGFVWSFIEKKVTIESWQGVLRQSVTFIGGILVAAGRWQQQSVDAVLTAITVLLPFVQSLLSRNKARQLAQNELQTQQLKR